VDFSGSSGFFHKKTDCHDITEILLKVALNTINKQKKTLYMELTLHRTLYSVHAVMKTKNCKYTSIQLEMLLYVYDIDP